LPENIAFAHIALKFRKETRAITGAFYSRAADIFDGFIKPNKLLTPVNANAFFAIRQFSSTNGG
jgi:hypothetical protein